MELVDLNNDGLIDFIVVCKEFFLVEIEFLKFDLLFMNVGGVLVD